MSDVVAWLVAELDRVELLAVEASRHGEDPVVEGGEYWHWECRAHDHPVSLDPGRGEFVEAEGCGCWNVGLRSVEEYPSRSGSYSMVHIVLSAEEVGPAVAGHIAMHDPAAVLRRVAADRQILAEHANDRGDCRVCAGEADYSDDAEGNREWHRSAELWPCQTVRLLAEAWGWTEETA